jgi:hypothetical protein
MLGHIRNADQTSVYFNMLSNVTTEEKGTKIVLIRGKGNKKTRITIMLSVFADGHKLPPYVILWRKIMQGSFWQALSFGTSKNAA